MRINATVLALATVTSLFATCVVAAPSSSAKDTALAVGDWHRAAELGAAAADVVRALQARGQLAEMVAGESVVTIGLDNGVDVVALKPLPPLDPADTTKKDVRTVGLAGSGFAFSAKPGSIILYPAFAQDSFAPDAPAPTDGFRP